QHLQMYCARVRARASATVAGIGNATADADVPRAVARRPRLKREGGERKPHRNGRLTPGEWPSIGAD
ncbi:MAG: hypothetical protein ACYTFA_18155, partial [Planctomycetota bacterium]